MDELMKHLRLTRQTINLYAAQIIRNALVKRRFGQYSKCAGVGEKQNSKSTGDGVRQN